MSDQPDYKEGQSPQSTEGLPHQDDGLSWADRMLQGNTLTPKHRKLAELVVQGAETKEIAEKLGYSESYIRTLTANTKIKDEVQRLTERIYEDTIQKRLKAMADPALNEIEKCLTDQTARYKEQTKLEVAKWLLEKLDGKAVQKHDVGENILSLMMDKLDALKGSGSVRPIESIDVTAKPVAQLPEAPKSEEDFLKDWVTEFDQTKIR